MFCSYIIYLSILNVSTLIIQLIVYSLKAEFQRPKDISSGLTQSQSCDLTNLDVNFPSGDHPPPGEVGYIVH